MSRDLKELEPEFRDKLRQVIELCAKDDFFLVPFYTKRSLQDQAKLWRQSRSGPEVHNKIVQLNIDGAQYLADIIENVGPQYGRWATNAIPGLSWHNWGLACDCYVLDKNAAVWDSAHPGYASYAKHAQTLGLTAGHNWKSQDSVHVQGTSLGVINKYTLPQINDHFLEDLIEDVG